MYLIGKIKKWRLLISSPFSNNNLEESGSFLIRYRYSLELILLYYTFNNIKCYKDLNIYLSTHI